MNWPHFILWTAGSYLLYYPAMILYDLKTSGRKSPGSLSNELTFTEESIPISIEHAPKETPPKETAPKPQPAVIGSGGVTLKNLFGLCRDEAILYTKPVSF
ncbi:MAG: hypothetical protein M3O71_21350 [Bacteroidota bacterium]|nr:hypothetical protein [Bacteroidota bacterium]